MPTPTQPPTRRQPPPGTAAAGGERPFATRPGTALGLAATRNRVYASGTTQGVVWALDRQSGRLVATTRGGPSPADLLVSPAE